MHSVKKLKSHFITVRVRIWSKCQMIRKLINYIAN